jgi:sortase A
VKRLAALAASALMLVGVASTGQGLWIHAKAQLAQVLLERAHARTLAGEERVLPWPWADTWPVARLLAPDQGQDMIVLVGASGRTLAFGPAHVSGTASPGTDGNVALAGHRDTHFAFLDELAPGDELVLETPRGTRRYRVTDTRVQHETQTQALEPSEHAQLTLITCYPFDAIVPGGPLRYVIRAIGLPIANEPEEEALAGAPRPS